MAFNEDKIKRQSAGTSKGGQFAHKPNSAPSTSLVPQGEQVTEAVDQVRLNAADIARTDDNFRRSAYKLMHNFNRDLHDVEDLVQDSWVHLLDRDSRHGDIEKRVQDEKFQTLVVKTLGKRLYGEGAEWGLRDTDYRARRMLADREQEFQEQNGRRMSGRERHEAAADIRMNEFPPQGRPKPDFHQYRVRVSTDETIGEGGTTRGDLMGGGVRADFHIEQDEYNATKAINDAQIELEDGVVEKSEMRLRAWNLVAESKGAPKVKRGLEPDDARQVRRFVKEAGGAQLLAQRFLDGETTREEEVHLFAPFEIGSIGSGTRTADRDAVARTIRSFPSGDKLWEATTWAAAQAPEPEPAEATTA